MAAWVLLVLMPDAASLAATARQLLSAEQRCPRDLDTTDVTVCGLRRADRYRVPLIVHDAGDPAHEGVPAERERLLHRTNPVQDMGPFLVGGGMAGVKTTIGAGGARVATLRAPAP